MVKCKLIFLVLIFFGLLGIGNISGTPTILIFGNDRLNSTRWSSKHGGQSSTDPTQPLKIPAITELEAKVHLNSLGYNETKEFEALMTDFASSEEQTFEKLIRAFQRDADLNETGILDDETKLMIGTPRCGVLKKYVSQEVEVYKWRKNTLSYRIRNFPRRKRSGHIRSLIAKAFSEWSKVTNLDFFEVKDENADIEILFGHQFHPLRDEKCWFKDPSGTLAHAFLPETGDIHFNSLYFFDKGASLRDFFDTALHEIGHSLGLDHSHSKASLMYPYQHSQFLKPQPIDVRNIQALYGKRQRSRNFELNLSTPEFCSLEKIDAAVDEDDGTVFIFSGDFYYNTSEESPKGQLISSRWPGLPGNIDAAFRYTDGRAYFFKGTKVWRFRGSRLEAGHPRLISDSFRGLPNSIDATFVDGKGDIVATKGGQYWTYDAGKKRASSVMPISSLQGVTPPSLDAAVYFGNRLWTFKDTKIFEYTPNGFTEYDNSWFICKF
ncbi:matrix metalloproteinase-18-like [Uranotaenia lowii]|uniref:matrix metalloproteinase-18-like n=1 Tax=Uranotaenia lowii TaxID=190385 RepID=UPI00247A820D|nr:matrix metalloproteinase-18-like [Uranotaenia lowii]